MVMNKVVLICMAISVTMVFLAVLYLTPYFSSKKVKQGRFDLLQFINLFFVPVLIIPLFYFLKRVITTNPAATALNLPKSVSEIIFLIFLYFLILGYGIHGVAVVVAKHMKDLKHHRVWGIVEFFHHAFSHLLITVSAVMIIASFSVIEINHPGTVPMRETELALVVASGIVLGIVLALASVEGRIAKPVFYLLFALILAILAVLNRKDVEYRYLPFTSYVGMMLITALFALAVYGYRKKGWPEIVGHSFFD